MRDDPRAIRTRVGGMVRRLRQSRGLTQERLAELASNSSKHVGQIERGEVNVGLDVLARIALALSADVADLFVGPRRRHTSQQAAYLITRRELDQIEQVVRRVKSARARSKRAAE